MYTGSDGELTTAPSRHASLSVHRQRRRAHDRFIASRLPWMSVDGPHSHPQRAPHHHARRRLVLEPTRASPSVNSTDTRTSRLRQAQHLHGTCHNGTTTPCLRFANHNRSKLHTASSDRVPLVSASSLLTIGGGHHRSGGGVRSQNLSMKLCATLMCT